MYYTYIYGLTQYIIRIRILARVEYDGYASTISCVVL